MAPGRRLGYSGLDDGAGEEGANLADYHVKISGFDMAGSDDALLIGGGWSFSGASETSSAATLSFANRAAHQALTLLGDYRGGSFSAQSDGAYLRATY